MKLRYSLIFLLFAACSSHKEWTYREVVSSNPEFNSCLLRYQTKNEIIGIGVELLKGSFGTLGYLNVCSRQIPHLPETPNQSIVVFVIGDEKFPYKAERMEGGQKLLLPEDAKEKLIASLQDNKTVTIYLDGFMSTLEPSNFPKLYNRL
jgi:hypothetical protein